MGHAVLVQVHNPPQSWQALWDLRPKSKTHLVFCGQGGMRRLAVTIRQTEDCSVD